MALINFKDIDFTSVQDNFRTVEFNGSEIQVVNYLSIQDKYDLIMTTLTRADEVDLYNSFKTKFYFELHLVLMYSNIVISEEEKQDEIKLYDTLKRSGLMDQIIDLIPDAEKEGLWEDILAAQRSMMEYRRSVSALLNTTFEKAPGVIEKIRTLLTHLDKDKIEMISQLIINATEKK